MKFNYKSDYKKFKPNSKVKITFMDGKNEVTKKVRIISIGEKAISFEDKETVYECTPSEIKNIKKSRKILISIIIFGIFLLLITLVNYIYSYYYKYGVVSAYGVPPEMEDMTWYGVAGEDW